MGELKHEEDQFHEPEKILVAIEAQDYRGKVIAH
jgi:hypothetical protein